MLELFTADPGRRWTVEETIHRSRKDMTPNFRPGTAASYSDTNFQLLGKVIVAITGKPLEAVYSEVLFRPLGLRHTWLGGRSTPEAAPSGEVADVFSDGMKITGVRSNGSYWADGGIVSTAEDAVVFLQALNEGKIIRKDTLKSMHKWHKIQFPLQYGYGTMYFELPRLLNMVMRKPSLWGHSGSTGSFLYYAEELDLYMAGSINQTGLNPRTFKMMLAVMRAVQDDGR
jgi:CubicO group peptidase (beta-lactamase class C family)